MCIAWPTPNPLFPPFLEGQGARDLCAAAPEESVRVRVGFKGLGLRGRGKREGFGVQV